jgi:1-phosphatidylinositol-4-phosphate 5-kinase
MNNLFPAHKDIHETYDLKGSTIGRLYPEERARENPRAVLKDLNWIDRHKELELGPEKRALLTEQLRRDTEFLKELRVMDYSLLVGIHNMRRGNRDNVRRNTLRVFSPPDVHLPLQPHAQGNLHRRRAATAATTEQPHIVRRAMRLNANANLKSLCEGVLPEEDTGDRQHFLFCQDEGGLRATDEQNKPLDTVYYLGVIDILTPYGVVKRFEHLWKGMSADRVRPFPPLFFSLLLTDSVIDIGLVAQDQPGAAGRVRGPVLRIYACDHAWWRRRFAFQGRVTILPTLLDCLPCISSFYFLRPPTPHIDRYTSQEPHTLLP